jgi:hypothetical protein
MKPAIIDIQGIGPTAASALAENNINTLKALARASADQIAAVPGFSAERAAKVILAATELLAASGTSVPAEDKAKKGAKKGSKGKKDKKKKKKNKGKGKGKGKDKKKGK